MNKLNLPTAKLKTRNEEVFDRLRKKYVKLTPEEWVRQHFIAFLADHLGYPESRMISEYTTRYNHMNKRADIVFFNIDGSAELIVECKSPEVKITEDTFYQLARYISSLKARYLIMTNGIQHICAFVDKEKGELKYFENIPPYQSITD